MSNARPSERPPRVLFLGMQGNFSYPSLYALLASGIKVCAVVIPASDDLGQNLPALRSREQPLRVRSFSLLSILTTNIVQLAWEREIPVCEVCHLSEPQTISTFAAYQPDMICVACFPLRISPVILALPRLGCLNVHPSLLPANRGPMPLFWTFREGDERTGVTIHLMDEGMDTGDILAQEVIEVPDGISYAQLESQCAVLGGKLLVRAVWDLYRGRALPVPQDESRSSSHSFPTAEDFVVPVAQWSSRRISNFRRGLADGGEPMRFREGNE